MRDIDYLNQICASLGSTTTHKFEIDALNDWATLLGVATGRYNIDVLNHIDIAYGGSGGHKFDIQALNSISTLLGGATGTYRNEVLKVLQGGLLNVFALTTDSEDGTPEMILTDAEDGTPEFITLDMEDR